MSVNALNLKNSWKKSIKEVATILWCKECKKIFHEGEKCPSCNSLLQPDIPIEVHWCDHCKIPIVRAENEKIDSCPICNNITRYLCKDLRPVFPEERLLVECLVDKPFQWQDKSVWANNSRYYVDGKVHNVMLSKYREADIAHIIKQLEINKDKNDYKAFNEYIELFIQANKERLNWLINEAHEYIRFEAAKFDPTQWVISFSGGKDSTVTADVVMKALANPSIRHIFGDTTLEIPSTYDYVARYRKANAKAIFKTAKNRDQEFYKVCDDIGPPARMMRWCCTMFKTGPITRSLTAAFDDKEKVLTFYGIRKNESAARSKYNRTENSNTPAAVDVDGAVGLKKDLSSSVKIQKQAVASPIFYWSDLEIWLYLISEKNDFNDAYRLGFDRVGCWCCPNNTERSQFLAKIYMPDQWHKWRDFLISFARSIGKPDPEDYIDGGWWKARQGGNGVAAAEDIIIKQTNCTTEENARIYNLNKPISDAFYNLLVPFGKVSKELGRKLIGEVIVLDIRTNTPIISIQPYNQQGYDYSVKIKTMNITTHDDLQRMIGYQIKKYNACRRCLKCESVCKYHAITIIGSEYKIDEHKCTRCKTCVSAKYLEGGCLMEKFLRTRKSKE